MWTAVLAIIAAAIIVFLWGFLVGRDSLKRFRDDVQADYDGLIWTAPADDTDADAHDAHEADEDARERADGHRDHTVYDHETERP